MDGACIDLLVVFFGFVYYALLVVVYILRAHGRSSTEIELGLVFSLQLVPFIALWILNLFLHNDSGRLIAGLPIIVYLLYDLWYRQITRKKPPHHPKRWPAGLVVYLILLMIGSIGLNWYGFLVSQFYGRMLILAFFVMMAAFGYYQYRYNKSKRAEESGNV